MTASVLDAFERLSLRALRLITLACHKKVD